MGLHDYQVMKKSVQLLDFGIHEAISKNAIDTLINKLYKARMAAMTADPVVSSIIKTGVFFHYDRVYRECVRVEDTTIALINEKK